MGGVERERAVRTGFRFICQCQTAVKNVNVHIISSSFCSSTKTGTTYRRSPLLTHKLLRRVRLHHDIYPFSTV